MQKNILNVFFRSLKNISFCVHYWDGETIRYGDGTPCLTLRFHKPFEPNDFSDPLLAIGQAYMDDVLDFEGDFDQVVLAVSKNRERFLGKNKVLHTLTAKLLNAASTKTKQKENIRHHYDLGNDFFSMWLDPSMSYSCAYFCSDEDGLHQAQMQKIDHILRKLQLAEGETLLDIGSGWGQLVMRAAQHYRVKAVGITLSEQQYRKSMEDVKKAGLSDQVRIYCKDYLDLDPADEMYDKVVSVGMFEHVGKQNLSVYMEKTASVLKQGGLSMLHSIMNPKEYEVSSWTDEYIFPGGYIPSLRETVALLPEYDFHLLHAESLRMHYAKTLDIWHANYIEHREQVEKMYGRRFYRMWDLYLKSSASGFRASGMNVYQLLYSKGLNNDLHMTLDHVYGEKEDKK